MKTNIKDFSIFCIILDHVLPVCIAYACDILYMCYINKYLKYIYTGKKKFDKKKQCIQIFSDICTVSDEAFGRLTIERCWDTWLTECQNMNNINSTNMQKKVKHQSVFTMNKTNKRFGGWSSEGMKRYDEIAEVVKSDREHNQQVEYQFKDFMMTKMYGDQTNAPIIVPVKVLSDIHSKLGETYVPYNEFSMLKILSKNNTMQTDVKNIYPDSIASNTDKCVIKHTATPTKHKQDTDKSNIKHTITPTKHGLPDSILSQPDVIQQKVKTLAEMEREIYLKQNKKNLTNIHDIYNSDKLKTSEIVVSHNEC